jgi:8-oxo-dGTP pyrophosphatase MutT (NUDIX family)
MPHIHELYDFTVGVHIVFEGKALLVNHPRYDMWIPMGGHVELHEDPEETLFREIEEETGLEVTILSTKPPALSKRSKPIFTPNFVDVHEANLPHKHINFTYFARAHAGNARLSDEHTSLKWFTASELHEPRYNLDPMVIFYAEEAIKLAGTA